jgi:hypothetical protein
LPRDGGGDLADSGHGGTPAASARVGGRGHIETKIGNHTFWATGITANLENGGTLEKAATMANHASASTMLS